MRKNLIIKIQLKTKLTVVLVPQSHVGPENAHIVHAYVPEK